MKHEVLNVLCMYLPYRVKFKAGLDSSIYTLVGINPTACGTSEIQALKDGVYYTDLKIEYNIKPILRPRKSMTISECIAFNKLFDTDSEEYKKIAEEDNAMRFVQPKSISFMEPRQLMFLLYNKFNFLLKEDDYIEAPEGIYEHYNG